MIAGPKSGTGAIHRVFIVLYHFPRNMGLPENCWNWNVQQYHVFNCLLPSVDFNNFVCINLLSIFRYPAVLINTPGIWINNKTGSLLILNLAVFTNTSLLLGQFYLGKLYNFHKFTDNDIVFFLQFTIF
jgi:hypothetical protein